MIEETKPPAKLIKLNGMNPAATMEESIIKGLLEKIMMQKEKLIKAKLHEMGLMHLIEKLKEQKFKRIVCDMSQAGEETYWVDNGTNEGLKIMTFKKFEPKFNPETSHITGELEFYY